MLDHGDGTGQPGLVEQALRGTLASALTRDDILDNITLYWLTNTGVSAGRGNPWAGCPGLSSGGRPLEQLSRSVDGWMQITSTSGARAFTT